MAFSYTDFRVVDIGISSAHFICHFLQDRVKATLRREDGDFNGGKKALSATTYVFWTSWRVMLLKTVDLFRKTPRALIYQFLWGAMLLMSFCMMKMHRGFFWWVRISWKSSIYWLKGYRVPIFSCMGKVVADIPAGGSYELGLNPGVNRHSFTAFQIRSAKRPPPSIHWRKRIARNFWRREMLLKSSVSWRKSYRASFCMVAMLLNIAKLNLLHGKPSRVICWWGRCW